MEKINLKEILAKHDKNYQSGYLHNVENPNVQGANAINAMKEVWDLAVEKCKEGTSLYHPDHGNIGEEFMGVSVDLNSIEQVKELIT